MRPSRSLAGLARIEGLELVRAALDAGEGVLLFTGHFTCTELAARLVSEALGRPLAVVVRRNNSVCLEQAMAQARSRVFSPVLEKKDVRGLLRTLLGGHGLVYSADQNFTYQNAFVPFFGIQAATLTSTPELARRGQARVLPFWFHREADGTLPHPDRSSLGPVGSRPAPSRRRRSTCASWRRWCASTRSSICGCIAASRHGRRASRAIY